MIFLSKDCKDPYINILARAVGHPVVDSSQFQFGDSQEPIMLRGILKKKIIHKCWDNNRPFYFMDTGYFGNEVKNSNPHGWKYWHRVVKDDLQHTEIRKVPDDRFRSLKRNFNPWKKNGKKILIAAPDEKPCKFYGIELHQWIDQTVKEIKKHTDRPIEIRERKKNRYNRVAVDTLEQALNNDVFALVTFNSNAAVESVFHGIPVFTLAPSNAAQPVGKTDLSEIEKPYYASDDERYAWGCSLAYGQVHTSELRSGKALDIILAQ